MKRFICILLALMLCLGTLAEPLTDETAALTAGLKNVLDIGDNYDAFDVSSMDDLRYLYWCGEDGGCSVTAGADGTVYNFYMYDSTEYRAAQGFGARFPALNTSELTACAGSFLDRLITSDGWGYRLNEAEPSLVTSGARAYVNGYLTLYGTRTDITISLSLDTDTGKVLSYSRSDAYLSRGAAPAQAGAQVGAEKALALLKANAVLKCVYEVVEDGEMARLVYKPVLLSGLIISAATGEPVYSDNGYSGADNGISSMARAEAADYGLTEYELEGISVYEGAQDISALEQALRANPYLGLTAEYELRESGYYTADSAPCAQLTFSDGSGTRIARVDAATGRLLSLYSYGSGQDYSEERPVDTAAGGAIAQNFLTEYYPEYAAQTELTDAVAGGAGTVQCTFTRVYDGYPFEANSVSVTVDPADGTVRGFNYSWDGGQEFCAAPATPISSAEALELLTDSATADLLYASVYNADTGTYDLTLVWTLTGASDAWALDAETGKQYTYTAAQPGVYTYDSLDGVPYADEIIMLGQYGIGVNGVDFNAACTPDLLMAFILQAAGYGSVDDVAAVFSRRYGTIPADTVTRAELARVVSTVAGYGNALALSGIYTLDAADWESVPASAQAATAIGCTCGFIGKDESGRINADEPATIAEAAHAVYVLLGGK